MAKVWCAENECKYNDRNLCKAKEINLAAGHMHTVHEGFRPVWTCRTFEESALAAELKAQFVQLMEGKNHA